MDYRLFAEDWLCHRYDGINSEGRASALTVCGRERAISKIDYCNVLGQWSPYCYHELRPIHLSYKNKEKINNNSNEPLIHMLASLERPTQPMELGANM